MVKYLEIVTVKLVLLLWVLNFTSPEHQMKLCLVSLFIGYRLTNKPRTKPKQNINHSTFSTTAEIRECRFCQPGKAAPGWALNYKNQTVLSRAASFFKRYEALSCPHCPGHTLVLGKVLIRTAWLAPGSGGHSSPAFVSPACTTSAIVPPQPGVKPDLTFQMQIRMTLCNPSEQTLQCFLGFLPKLTPVIPLHSLPSTEAQPAPHSHCISKFASLDPPQLIILYKFLFHNLSCHNMNLHETIRTKTDPFSQVHFCQGKRVNSQLAEIILLVMTGGSPRVDCRVTNPAN